MAAFSLRKPLEWRPDIIRLIAVLGIAMVMLIQASKLILEDPLNRDFTQTWLMARAIASGMEPYVSVTRLQQIFFGRQSEISFSQISPHPPILILFSFPFSLLPLRVACGIWLAICLGCSLWTASRLMSCLVPDIPRHYRLLVIALMLQSLPVGTNAYFCNWTSLFWLLLVEGWIALERRRWLLATICFSALASGKIIYCLFLIFPVVHRQFRMALAAMISAFLVHVGASYSLGISLESYWNALADNGGRYSGDFANFSLWTVGPKLFEGTNSAYISNPLIPGMLRLWWSPILSHTATVVTILAAVLALVWSMAKVSESRQRDVLLFLVLPFLMPVTWDHYLMITYPAIIWLWMQRSRQSFSFSMTLALFAATVWFGLVGGHLVGTILDGVTWLTVIVEQTLGQDGALGSSIGSLLCKLIAFGHILFLLLLWYLLCCYMSHETGLATSEER